MNLYDFPHPLRRVLVMDYTEEEREVICNNFRKTYPSVMLVALTSKEQFKSMCRHVLQCVGKLT